MDYACSSVFLTHNLELILQLYTSSGVHRAKDMHYVLNRAHKTLADQRQEAPVQCQGPASLSSAQLALTSLPRPHPHSRKATAKGWLLTEHAFLKTQCHAGRETATSSDLVTKHLLLWDTPVPAVERKHNNLAPDENRANKEHKNILTKHLKCSNDGLQPFHLD